MHKAGVTNPDHITIYMEENDTAKLQNFLNNQKGIRITTDSAFSGMESYSVLYISKTGININHRGSLMRAVFQSVQISGANYDGGFYSLLDITFMKCSNEGWAGCYYYYKDSKMSVCVETAC